jgi:hypothetical protein
MQFLRQSTATLVHIGPLVASSGGALETGITLSAGQLEQFVAGASSVLDISTRTWTHISNGVYSAALLTSDLTTLGPMQIHAHPTSVVPLMTSFNVLSPQAYDALMGGLNMPSDIQAVAGVTQSAGNLQAAASAIIPVTIGNGSTTNVVATNLGNSIGGFYAGRTLLFISGALQGQAASITGYNGTTKQLTVSQMTGAPANGDQAVIV